MAEEQSGGKKTGFMDILPFILGGAAGLISPRVGPALQGGVQAWQQNVDRRERKVEKKEAKVRQKKEDERGDVRWADWVKDQDYESVSRANAAADREQRLKDAEIDRQRGEVRWNDFVTDQEWERQERVRELERRPGEDAWKEETRNMTRAQFRYSQGQQTLTEQEQANARVGFEAIGESAEGKQWLAIPGVKEWALSAGPEKALKGFADYQQDQLEGKGGWEWFSRTRSLAGDRRSMVSQKAELEKKIRDLTVVAGGDVRGNGTEGMSDTDDVAGTSAEKSALEFQLIDLERQIALHDQRAAAMGYVFPQNLPTDVEGPSTLPPTGIDGKKTFTDREHYEHEVKQGYKGTYDQWLKGEGRKMYNQGGDDAAAGLDADYFGPGSGV